MGPGRPRRLLQIEFAPASAPIVDQPHDWRQAAPPSTPVLLPLAPIARDYPEASHLKPGEDWARLRAAIAAAAHKNLRRPRGACYRAERARPGRREAAYEGARP